MNTRQVHVINGAMRFLCSRIVDTILMEVEYVKNGAHGCNGTSMQNTLVSLGFAIKNEAGQVRNLLVLLVQKYQY